MSIADIPKVKTTKDKREKWIEETFRRLGEEEDRLHRENVHAWLKRRAAESESQTESLE